MKRRSFIKILSLFFASLLISAVDYAVYLFGRKGREAENLPPPLFRFFKDKISDIRPPGAFNEREFIAKCIGCSVCVSTCKNLGYNALSLKSGLSDLGTPVVDDMRNYPCTLCMECVKVCPTGAINRVQKEKVKMGIALIDFELCLGWNGDVCLSCSKACPFGASIFEFYNSDWGNQPFINENCKGCGLCVKYCPVGGSAIRVVNLDEYEKVKDKYLSEFKLLLDLEHAKRYEVVYSNIAKIMERGRVYEREFQ
jgi:ferredoxin-type protein NapG